MSTLEYLKSMLLFLMLSQDKEYPGTNIKIMNI